MFFRPTDEKQTCYIVCRETVRKDIILVIDSFQKKKHSNTSPHMTLCTNL